MYICIVRLHKRLLEHVLDVLLFLDIVSQAGDNVFLKGSACTLFCGRCDVMVRRMISIFLLTGCKSLLTNSGPLSVRRYVRFLKFKDIGMCKDTCGLGNSLQTILSNYPSRNMYFTLHCDCKKMCL